MRPRRPAFLLAVTIESIRDVPYEPLVEDEIFSPRWNWGRGCTVGTIPTMKRLDLALFILRVGVGMAMLFGHGLPKLMNFAELSATFPDPLRVGSTASLVLIILSEVVAALALILGFYGRWAAGIMATGLTVALLIHHANDPLAERELALMYLIPLVALMITGPGRYAVRHRTRRNRP